MSAGRRARKCLGDWGIGAGGGEGGRTVTATEGKERRCLWEGKGKRGDGSWGGGGEGGGDGAGGR